MFNTYLASGHILYLYCFLFKFNYINKFLLILSMKVLRNISCIMLTEKGAILALEITYNNQFSVIDDYI